MSRASVRCWAADSQSRPKHLSLFTQITLPGMPRAYSPSKDSLKGCFQKGSTRVRKQNKLSSTSQPPTDRGVPPPSLFSFGEVCACLPLAVGGGRSTPRLQQQEGPLLPLVRCLKPGSLLAPRSLLARLVSFTFAQLPGQFHSSLLLASFTFPNSDSPIFSHSASFSCLIK